MNKREMTLAEFEEATAIREAMKAFEKRHSDWKRSMNSEVDRFADELVTIRDKCKHWFASWHGDASLNDAFQRCDICGKEAKSL